MLTVTGSTFENNAGGGLAVMGGSSASISGSTFQGNVSYAFYATGESPVTLTGNTIQNNTGWAVGVGIDNLSKLTQSGNVVSGNGRDDLVISGGTLTGDLQLGHISLGGHENYVLGTDLTVPTGITLTVEAGVMVMGEDSAELRILGALAAIGTPIQPITFTSAANTAPDQWQGIVFDGGAGDLQYVTVRYGGNGNSFFGEQGYSYPGGNITVRNVLTREVRIENSRVMDEYSHGYLGYSYEDYGLYVENSQVVVNNTLFSGNGYTTNDYALYATGADTVLTVTGSTFENNAGGGLAVMGGSAASVTSSTIQDNGAAGIRSQDSTVTIESSSILGNATFGIENLSSTPVVQARYLWWGHPSGPYNLDTNPDGVGNPVSSNVSYDPWRVSTTVRQPVDLTLGQPITATIGTLSFADYRLVMTAGQSLVVTVTPLNGSNKLWVYSRSNDLPLWSYYDLRTQAQTQNGTYELMITSTQAGNYYFSVYGQDVAETGGNYQMVVNVVGRYLSDVSPRSAGNSGQVTLSLTGIPFEEGMRVELRGTGLPTQVVDNLTLASSTDLWANFNLTSAEPGIYDVVGVWPDGSEASLTGAFTIKDGTGSHLELSVEGPGPIRPGRQYVFWLNYANTGDADMPAPFLYVSSSIPGTLLYTNGYSTTDTLIWMASSIGSPGNVLSPGQSGTIPFVVLTSQDVDLAVGVLQENETAFDWSTYEQKLRPDGFPEAEWQVQWGAITAKIGNTHKEVLQTLRSYNQDRSGYADLDSLLRYSIFLAGQDDSQAGESQLSSQAINLPDTVGYDGSDVQVIPAPGTTFDPDKPTIVITHGWNKDGTNDFQRFNDLSQEAAAAYGSTHNVVMVYWPQGANTSLLNPRGASANIPVAAQAAMNKLDNMGYSRWGDTIYIGESFGNGINAWMSANADPSAKGTALMISAANSLGYPEGKRPDYKNDFKNVITIQTRDMADDGKVGHRSILLRDPDCGGRPCNLFGESHTAGIRYLTRLLEINPGLARLLIEGRWDLLGLQDRKNGLYDGDLDWQGILHTLPMEQWSFLLNEFTAGIVDPFNFHHIALVRPQDPNEKVGPDGLGSERLVNVDSALEYTIYFENVITATAPAQEVFITDALNPNLDWNTFQITEITFGEQIISVQEQGGQFYARSTTADYRAGVNKNWWVDINVQLNPVTGQASWIFRTLDSETGQLPDDPLAGFLPPNDTTGRGEGHVSFAIRPKADTPAGTVLTNSAEIVFDTNPPIETNQVWNTTNFSADLGLIMAAAPDPVNLGQDLTFVITVTNGGPGTATGVILTDTLPAGASLSLVNPSQGVCTGTAIITCNLGSLDPSAQVTVTIIVIARQVGLLTNLAYVDGNGEDMVPKNNHGQITVQVKSALYLPVILRP